MSRGERGAASVLVVALLSLLCLIGAALGVVAAMVVSHRHAQSAADLAALAGATAVASGGDGCVRARATAEANRAVLVGCSVVGRDVRVQVEVDGPGWLGQRGGLLAEARAGPDT